MKKIGLVGCGYWGKNYIKTIEKISGAKLSWICDRGVTIAASALPAGCRFTKNYADILHDKETDAVIIVTPPKTHYPLAKEALLSGKDVLLEKPMTTDSREAQELIRLAKKTNQILMVGHTYIYNSAIIELRKRITRGELGNIRYIYSRRSAWGPTRKDTSAVWSLAPHDISIANFLTNQLPKTVNARGACFLTKGLADSADLTLNYKNNIKAFFHVSWLEPQKIRETTVIGDKKMAVFDDLDKKLTIFKNSDLKSFSVIKTGIMSPLEKECRHFLDCINKRKEPLTNGNEGYRNVLILEAAQKSLITGKDVTIKI